MVGTIYEIFMAILLIALSIIVIFASIIAIIAIAFEIYYLVEEFIENIRKKKKTKIRNV